jgi:hypothetical protein
VTLGVVTLAWALSTPALAAPGDPFGGDDTGCAASTKLGNSCAKAVLVTIVKLRRSVLGCHLTQAGQAFKTGMGTPGFSNQEELCEVGNPQNSAKAKFDGRIANLAARGCDATVIANANAARDVILADQTTPGSMDALNGAFFCDPTSGNLIDPGGDDAGYIPSTDDHYKCSVVVAKAWSKLDTYVSKCHYRMGLAVFADRPFDEDACEDGDPSRSALARYNATVGKYIAAGICPPCLADAGPTSALSLGTTRVSEADADLGDTYVCPGP